MPSNNGKSDVVEPKPSQNTVTNNNNKNKDGDSPVKTVQMGAPPDGGWGWVIVFSSFSISLLVDGVCFTYGIFFHEFREKFNASDATASWVGSVLNGSYLTIGPIVGALVNIYGCRNVTMAGGLLAFIAFFLSTFSNSIGLLVFTYGFLGGVGFGLMYLPAIVMVGYYFERRRALATGVACCGSGIGAFLFAPFTEYLLHEYGWRGALWILSALVFHGFVFAMFYRPIPPSVDSNHSQSENLEAGSTNKEAERTELLKAEEGEDKNAKSGDAGRASPISSELRNQIYETLQTDSLLNPGLNPTHRARSMTLHVPEVVKPQGKDAGGKQDTARLAFSQDISLLHSAKPKKDHLTVGSQSTLTPLKRKDIFYSGSIWHLREFQELGSVDEFRREMTSGTDGSEPAPSPASTGFFQSFISIFDFSLLKSPTFIIYGFSCFLCMAGFFVPFIYMPTHAIDLGFGATEAAFLISIIGITNTVGRVAVGFISDQPWADCLIINNSALIIGGVATMFVPYYPEYYVLAIYAAVFGTAIAVFVSLRSILMVELMGLEKLTTAFGFVIMCQGMSTFLGAPIAGAISDATGNYNAAFYLAGITLTLSGIICIPLRRISIWENGKKEEAEQQTVDQKDSPALPNGGGDPGKWSRDHELEGGTSVTEATPMV